MTQDPLYGCVLKIEWTKQHIGEMHAAYKAWLQGYPYAIVTDVNPADKMVEVKVRLVTPLPDRIVMLCSYILYNLRSALDYLAVSLAVQNGAKHLSRVYFPIVDSLEDLGLPSNQRKIDELSPDAKRFLTELQPYKGGNDILYALHRLNIIDKHRVPIDAEVDCALGRFKESSTFYVEIPPLGRKSLKEDVVIYRYHLGDEPKPEVQVSMNIAFSQLATVSDKPFFAVIHETLEMVEEIIFHARRRFFAV